MTVFLHLQEYLQDRFFTTTRVPGGADGSPLSFCASTCRFTTTVALSASLRGHPTSTTAPHTWRSGRLRVVVLCFHLLLSPSSFSRPPNVTVSEVATRPNRRLSSSSSSSNCEQRAGRKCRHRGEVAKKSKYRAGLALSKAGKPTYEQSAERGNRCTAKKKTHKNSALLRTPR